MSWKLSLFVHYCSSLLLLILIERAFSSEERRNVLVFIFISNVLRSMHHRLSPLHFVFLGCTLSASVGMFHLHFFFYCGYGVVCNLHACILFYVTETVSLIIRDINKWILFAYKYFIHKVSLWRKVPSAFKSDSKLVT